MPCLRSRMLRAFLSAAMDCGHDRESLAGWRVEVLRVPMPIDPRVDHSKGSIRACASASLGADVAGRATPAAGMVDCPNGRASRKRARDETGPDEPRLIAPSGDAFSCVRDALAALGSQPECGVTPAAAGPASIRCSSMQQGSGGSCLDTGQSWPAAEFLPHSRAVRGAIHRKSSALDGSETALVSMRAQGGGHACDADAREGAQSTSAATSYEPRGRLGMVADRCADRCVVVSRYFAKAALPASTSSVGSSAPELSTLKGAAPVTSLSSQLGDTDTCPRMHDAHGQAQQSCHVLRSGDASQDGPRRAVQDGPRRAVAQPGPWRPPHSPYGLLEELMWDRPWRLLLCVRTLAGKHAC